MVRSKSEAVRLAPAREAMVGVRVLHSRASPKEPETDEPAVLEALHPTSDAAREMVDVAPANGLNGFRNDLPEMG